MDFEYLLFLQNLRAEAPNFINSLLLFISEFAAGSLPVVIIVVFYWCIDKRTGQRMGLCFAGATMVTQLIKNIACVYRPWKQDARLQSPRKRRQRQQATRSPADMRHWQRPFTATSRRT